METNFRFQNREVILSSPLTFVMDFPMVLTLWHFGSDQVFWLSYASSAYRMESANSNAPDQGQVHAMAVCRFVLWSRSGIFSKR